MTDPYAINSGPYSVACPKCSSKSPDPCFMRRAPYDPCAWPHKEREQIAKALLESEAETP